MPLPTLSPVLNSETDSTSSKLVLPRIVWVVYFTVLIYDAYDVVRKFGKCEHIIQFRTYYKVLIRRMYCLVQIIIESKDLKYVLFSSEHFRK